MPRRDVCLLYRSLGCCRCCSSFPASVHVCIIALQLRAPDVRLPGVHLASGGIRSRQRSCTRGRGRHGGDSATRKRRNLLHARVLDAAAEPSPRPAAAAAGGPGRGGARPPDGASVQSASTGRRGDGRAKAGAGGLGGGRQPVRELSVGRLRFASWSTRRRRRLQRPRWRTCVAGLAPPPRQQLETARDISQLVGVTLPSSVRNVGKPQQLQYHPVGFISRQHVHPKTKHLLDCSQPRYCES